MRAILDHTEKLTPIVTTFWFRPQAPVHYIAGQFVEVTLPGDPAGHDSRGPQRWFTLSSSPTEPLLGITTKFTAKTSSFKRQLLQLQPGAEVTFSEPMGDFVLPKDTGIPLVFIASGIGATPIRSMSRWLQDKHEKRPITMVYAGRTADDLAFLDFFTARYGRQLHVVQERRLTADDILTVANDLPESLIYLAGPEPMVEVLGHALERSGIAKYRIVIDFFSGYTNDDEA